MNAFLEALQADRSLGEALGPPGGAKGIERRERAFGGIKR